VQLEQRSREAETQITQHQASVEAKLARLAPQARNQYAELMSELQAMQPELFRMEADGLALQQEVAAAEAELQNNHIKQRALSLQEQVRALTERKYELESEEAKMRMSPEEQVEELKAKIKRDNAENDRLQVQIRGLVESIKKAESQVGSVKPIVDRSAALASMPLDNPGEDTQHKYEELLEKERDLNQFLASFDEDQARKRNELRGRQGDVVAALEKMSKMVRLLGDKALPDSAKFREMQDELEYKKVQVSNAQTTQVRLKGELEMRRGELDKIDTLEDKIKEELVALQSKKGTMEEELVEYGKVEQLKVKAEKTKKYLEQQRNVLLGRKDLIKSVAEEKKKKHDAKCQQLQENDLHITLERLEQKIRTLEQGIFQMNDFVRGKEAEADFRPLVNEVTVMVDALNIEVQKMAAL
jgi:intraflagellar transport protein 74